MLLELPVVKLEHAADLPLPSYATDHAAGLDLLAAVAHDILLPPGERRLVETGIAIQLPVGYEAQVRPRSGLALKSGITLLNSPGTIDADYRGEIKLILINLGKESFAVQRGMRIAQLIIAPVTRIVWQPVEALEESLRAAGGFGSTGVK
jgi:dUTP pyrophosphatase